MKRHWMAGLAALLTLICVTGQAQDRQVFNHLSLGISLGTDGLGADLALPLSPFVQLRAGYAIFPYTFKKTFDVNSEVAGVELTSFPASYTFWKGGDGKLLMDVVPGKKTPFHLTLGVFAGWGKIIHWEADWQYQIDEEEYASRAFTYNGITFSTDSKGILQADAQLKHWIPYAGIGFGRAVNPGKGISINADLGVLITGGTSIQTYNYVNNPSGEPVPVGSKNLVSPGGRQLDKGWADRVSRLPVLPMFRITVFFNLL